MNTNQGPDLDVIVSRLAYTRTRMADTLGVLATTHAILLRSALEKGHQRIQSAAAPFPILPAMGQSRNLNSMHYQQIGLKRTWKCATPPQSAFNLCTGQ